MLCSSCFNKVTADFGFDSDQNEEEKLTELLQMATSNLSLIPIARTEFSQRYQEYAVQLCGVWSDRKQNLTVYKKPGKRVQITDLSLAEIILKHFGDLIKNLQISENFTNDILRRRRCSTPFPEVEHLSVDIKEVTCDIGTFGQMFPKLRALDLTLQSDIDYSFIDCELPLLENLYIRLTNDSQQRMDQIERFMRKNPQIKSIVIIGFPQNYVKIINELLPNIENFTIPTINTRNDTVRLENVKHFTYGKE